MAAKLLGSGAGVVSGCALVVDYVLTISISVAVGRDINESEQPPPVDQHSSRHWFESLDRNADGDVSRLEFPGPLEFFDKLDTDGDGLLSKLEAER